MKSIKKAFGYSLYELLITLGLVSVVLLLGMPTFGSLAADKKLRVEVDALFHAVHLARSESIVRRRVVSLCPSLDGQHCSGDYDWSNGWILFVNKGRQNPLLRDDDELLLRYHRVGHTARISANRRGFSLRATVLRATNGTIVFCDHAGRTENRALVISYTGRPRVTRKDTRGRPHQCAD